MNSDKSDCIGAGNFYKLGNELEDSSASPQIEVSVSPMNQIAPNTQTRFDPSTGEHYCPPTLAADLQNSDWYIRMRAAWTIGKTRDVSGIVPLINALNDPHQEVRGRAQEALKALKSGDDPLPVRVLLCETVNDVQRTDMLVALAADRSTSGPITEWGSVRVYCEYLIDDDWVVTTDEEREALAKLKRAAAAVAAELANRSDANILLRAGEAQTGAHPNHLLRSAEPGTRPGEVENLLLPSSRE